ncbi:terpene synthase family protein [Streptomyces sp. NBC_01433]|uniref:terpene synthase family protein n=1 Tax=Streptomyces sp. NBC_01433 TaxID=2903864 RepID=UPI00224D0BAB|nr:terpene synthase family protein [Streptomyces sp. NBC_01433]MCX4679451.1 terpene synthase family protein [Streptomyces sp. NBC_01433]
MELDELSRTLLADLRGALPGGERHHPRQSEINEDLRSWVLDNSLASSTEEDSRFLSAGFSRMASDIFPHVERSRVLLAAKWGVVLFYLDDLHDEQFCVDEQAVTLAYARLLSILRDVEPMSPSAFESAFLGLWRQTGDLMSESWRSRFIRHFMQHRDGLRTEAVNRRSGHIPAVEEYLPLRRRTNGTFMQDLHEVVLRQELPRVLADSISWESLCAASNDITAWCNDMLSFARETQVNDPHNLVTVLANELRCDMPSAMKEVAERIRLRARSMNRLREEWGRTIAVADSICAATGGHLSWALASPRYMN